MSPRGLLSLLLLVAVFGAQAAEHRSLADYTHTAWTQKDGAPTGVWAIAQTADGWLWLGSDRGLARFDGSEFENVDLFGEASSEPRAVINLYATPDGDLWIVFHTGKIKVLRHGDPKQVVDIAASPAGRPIRSIVVDGDGRPWAASSAGLFLYDHGTWQVPGAAWNVPSSAPDALLLDGGGALWIIGEAGDRRLPHGAHRFDSRDSGLEHGDDVQYGTSSDGRLWSSGDRPLYLGATTATQGHPYVRPPAASGGLIVDEEGTAWDIIPGVVSRVPNARGSTPDQLDKPPSDQLFTSANGLTSDSAMTVMEDRSGNIWIGTPQGLDRFRRNDFRSSGLPSNLRYFAVAAEPRGEVTVGTALGNSSMDALWRVGDTSARRPGFSDETTAIYRQPSGALLIGSTDGMWDWNEGSPARRPALAGEPKAKVQAMATDADNHLWVSYKVGPVLRQQGDHWLVKGGLDGLPNASPIRMVTSASGELWQGYYANLVTITAKGRVRTFTQADGVRTITVAAILTGDTPLIGGERGLAWFDGHAFHMFNSASPGALNGITGIVMTADGTLWLNGYEGAIRVTNADLRRAMSDPGFALPARIFGGDEGMPGGAQQVRPLPTLTQGTDGRLWFATSGGLVWTNPSDMAPVLPPPAVQLRALKVRDALQRLRDSVVLPAGTRSLTLSYTAVELGRPESLSFRYRLDGVDTEWQSAGSRREAIYTNLGPGRYRFRVSASRSSGAWASAETTLSFTIAPAFYQTGWFLALCVAAALLALRVGYVLRIRQITRRLRARLQDRHAERERIARELHDTLLQGVSTLLLEFRVVTRQLGDGLAKASLTRALERGEAAISEGRERVGELRAESVEIPSLEAAFQALAHEFEGDDAPVFQVQVSGRVRRLDPIVLDELHRIGREVLFNAYAHAQSSRIDITLAYRSDSLHVNLKDNGIGIDPDILRQGGKPGHWGLRGMQERATSIGAELRISSSSHAGTEVLVIVPAARAYPARRKNVRDVRVAR